MFERRTESWAGRGRPVPDPPQLLHDMRPEPEHVRQPKSPSDQREHMHLTRPVPLQLGHLGKGPAIGFWSITDLTSTAPANTLRPVASWVNTIGPIFSIDEDEIKHRGIEAEEKKIENYQRFFLPIFAVKLPDIILRGLKSGMGTVHVDACVFGGFDLRGVWGVWIFAELLVFLWLLFLLPVLLFGRSWLGNFAVNLHARSLQILVLEFCLVCSPSYYLNCLSPTSKAGEISLIHFLSSYGLWRLRPHRLWSSSFSQKYFILFFLLLNPIYEHLEIIYCMDTIFLIKF